MSNGLNLNDVVQVPISFSPIAAAGRSFGNALILGSSKVIDVAERLRLYTSAVAVGADFGTTSQEYLAATRYFGQSPQPKQVYVGRWAQSATPGIAHGGALTASQQLIATWNAITAGSFKIGFDGGALTAYTGLNFSGAANLNAVAAIITTALGSAGTCVWSASKNRFDFISATTGAASAVTFATPDGTAVTTGQSTLSGAMTATIGTTTYTNVVGTDISAMLAMTAATGAVLVAGIVAETILAAEQILANKSNDWYGLYICDYTNTTITDFQSVAAAIEADPYSRMFAITVNDPNTKVAGNTTNLAYLLNQAKYNRSFVQFSSLDPHAAISELARILTVDPTGSATTITLKFKQEPGVLAETLTEAEAVALKAIKCNVFVNYANSTAIIQEGTVASGYYIDEIWGTDWLQNYVQTQVYNALYGALKIPQTDAGTNILVGVIIQGLEVGVTNGLIAPGVWTGPNIGNLQTGQTLTLGYYVYAQPIAQQSVGDRAARAAPPITVAIKLAGAFHSAVVPINVNR